MTFGPRYVDHNVLWEPVPVLEPLAMAMIERVFWGELDLPVVNARIEKLVDRPVFLHLTVDAPEEWTESRVVAKIARRLENCCYSSITSGSTRRYVEPPTLFSGGSSRRFLNQTRALVQRIWFRALLPGVSKLTATETLTLALKERP